MVAWSALGSPPAPVDLAFRRTSALLDPLSMHLWRVLRGSRDGSPNESKSYSFRRGAAVERLAKGNRRRHDRVKSRTHSQRPPWHRALGDRAEGGPATRLLRVRIEAVRRSGVEGAGDVSNAGADHGAVLVFG
ncbi:hypothetical protein GCM10009530_62550 [Microbispora corallina]|uniref:Uncharacterized protein n=1 Tax=Microbispora corallina TaxID=83302 RepID=A0ABQ4G7V1_9ACTN|nr:hypothetical protein Mco01_61040 [Microbispora corallina]